MNILVNKYFQSFFFFVYFFNSFFKGFSKLCLFLPNFLSNFLCIFTYMSVAFSIGSHKPLYNVGKKRFVNSEPVCFTDSTSQESAHYIALLVVAWSYSRSKNESRCAYVIKN